jgi:ribosomal protein S18 acetylase RimI-like enzyme
MGITIAPMCAQDVPGVQELFVETWIDTYPNVEAGITEEDIRDHFKQSLTPETIKRRTEQLRDMPTNERRLIAHADGRPVGLCVATIMEDRNTLLRFYVLPAYQGKGIGTKLWNEMLRCLPADRPTYLEVATYNKKAQRFYEKRGFIDTGVRTLTDRFHFKSGALMPNKEMMCPPLVG